MQIERSDRFGAISVSCAIVAILSIASIFGLTLLLDIAAPNEPPLLLTAPIVVGILAAISSIATGHLGRRRARGAGMPSPSSATVGMVIGYAYVALFAA